MDVLVCSVYPPYVPDTLELFAVAAKAGRGCGALGARTGVGQVGTVTAPVEGAPLQRASDDL
jgi:hypothetical protein